MNFFRYNAIALAVGFVLDLLLGDPLEKIHPVVLMGKYISISEKACRRRAGEDRGKLRQNGMWLALSTIGLSMLVTAAIMKLAGYGGKWVFLAVMSILSWSCLSARSLDREGRGVAKALRRSLEAGRKQVARIVGRDTENLSEEEVAAAAVETIAENTCDGVIAPLLYLMIGGPVLAMGFKAASTLDSMVGYLDEHFRDIGRFSAKLDDALNFVPARISGVLLCLSAACSKLDAKNAFRIMARDHANHLSPNCGWSEAAAAGALHVQLGGSHEYFGKTIEKPTIGDPERAVTRMDIVRTCKMMISASIVWAIVMAIIGWIL